MKDASWAWVLPLLLASTLATAAGYRQLDWLDLLTDSDRKAMLNLPAIDHSVSPERAVSPKDSLSTRFTRDIKQKSVREKWEHVLNSATVRPELDGVKIRLGGYLVPLESAGNGKVTEFFLVPYMGACIHVPPPPPNQLVYLTFAKGMKFEPQDIYEAWWVEGTLHTQMAHKSIADAAYTMTGDTIRIYQE